MTFTLYMVRHGQTILNSYNRLQGWCDSPLTQKGINDAKSAGKHLADIKFDKAYHSDTTRAMRTCHFILENNHHSQDIMPSELKNFREQSFGYFEGNDAAQTWLMVGALHGCRTYNDILEKYDLEKRGICCMRPIHLRMLKMTSNIGPGSMLVLSIYVKTPLMAKKCS